ncbi:hypothetical protein HDU97_000155 [Phlyctochytrium planicorne]|nr:hypothetical protein HDU97_000155 [Phlyctochytrium planicorne]
MDNNGSSNGTSRLGIDALLSQLVDNPGSLNASALPEDSGKLAMVLKILEESRKLKEEERKGNEVQLEILKVLSSSNNQPRQPEQEWNAASSKPPPLMADYVSAAPDAELELLLSSATNQISSLDSLDLLAQHVGLGSTDLSLEALLNGDGNFPSSNSGFNTLQDFDMDSHIPSSVAFNGASLADGAMPNFGLYDNLDVAFPSTSSLISPDGGLSMSALLDLDSLTAAHSNLDPLISNRDIWQPSSSSASNYRKASLNASLSVSPVSQLDGSSKKKALFSDQSELIPISQPVISMITPMMFAVEGGENNAPETPLPLRPIPILPASPAEAFKNAAAHAAEKASSRRKTVEETFNCIQCGSFMGFLHLRGTQKTLETVMLLVDIKCKNCAGADSEGKDTGSSSKTRKRVRETPLVECEVCRKNLGAGSVRLAEQDSDGGVKPELQGIEVEVVCGPCGASYLFCSECGGGGKSRTGKWRPKELYSSNRKTCSLPHIRIGNAEVLYRVLEVPKELTSSVIRGVKDVFFDCLLSLYAIPSVIETPRFGSFINVRSEVESLWTRTVENAITSDLPTGLGGGKVYLTVAWIEKRHRNRGKGKNAVSKTPLPWLQKLALEGTVAPLKQEPTSPNMQEDEGSEINSPQLAGFERCYTAFAIFEWDRSHGTLFILQMAPRSIFVPSMESYGELIRRGVERVQADVRRDNAPPLEHLWCWTRAEEHSRLKVIPERLGFVPVEQYLRANPALERQWFDREGYEPLREEGVSVYATTIRDFLKLRFSGTSKKKALPK